MKKEIKSIMFMHRVEHKKTFFYVAIWFSFGKFAQKGHILDLKEEEMRRIFLNALKKMAATGFCPWWTLPNGHLVWYICFQTSRRT